MAGELGLVEEVGDFLTEVEVGVVGNGPTAMVLLGQLNRYAIKSALLSPVSGRRCDESPPWVVLWSRSLEILADLGLVAKCLQAGHKIHEVGVFAEGKRVVHFTLDELPSPYKFGLVLSYRDLTALLRAWLDGTDVAFYDVSGLKNLQQSDSGVKAGFSGVGADTMYLQARWLVGCDGRTGFVRSWIDNNSDTDKYGKRNQRERQVTVIGAEFIVKGACDEEEVAFFWHREGGVVCLPLGKNRFFLMAECLQVEAVKVLPGGTLDSKGGATEFIRHLLQARIVTRYALDRVETVKIMEVPVGGEGVYRKGKVFLAGTAARAYHPLGVQVINSGFQDAYNLGWKLGMTVACDIKNEDLLDSYVQERGNAAQQVARNAGIAEQVARLRHPVARYMRDRVAALLSSLEVVQERMRVNLSDLDLHYRKSDLSCEVVGLEGAAWTLGVGVKAGDRAPDAGLYTLPGEKRVSLFDLMRGEDFVALMFQGVSSLPRRYDELLKLKGILDEEFSKGYMKTFLILREPQYKPTGPALWDKDMILHRLYGAVSSCIYLIRPDGYVGFRCLPPGRSVVEYCRRVLGIGV